MDACMRNLSFAQYVSTLSALENRAESNEKARRRAGFQVESRDDEVVCPKPRKGALSCAALEFIKPVYPWLNVSRLGDCDVGNEILEIFLNKGECDEGEYVSFGCPSYYSPPVRTGNPIVHDTEFYSNRCLSPVNFVKTRAVVPSFSPNPSLRVEGFQCPGKCLP